MFDNLAQACVNSSIRINNCSPTVNSVPGGCSHSVKPFASSKTKLSNEIWKLYMFDKSRTHNDESACKSLFDESKIEADKKDSKYND